VKEIKANVQDFLKSRQMDYEDIDIEKNCKIFLEEMEKGLAGTGSSLEMIPTYIEAGKVLPCNEPVIAVDAGGTNFRVATVYFDKNRKPVIENSKIYPMPGVKHNVSKKEFFRAMAAYIKDVIDSSKKIGFCFSYATEIFPNKNGKLICFSKEIKAPEVIGELVGENIKLALDDLGCDSNKHIVLLNDTVTTLLAGQAAFDNRIFDTYIGFILGTGTNCCYVEENKNITKKKDLDPAKSQIINIESGAYGKGPRGSIDIEFDESTNNPGINVFEKMISGAYLGPLCLMTACQAAEQGLFSDAVAAKLKQTKQLETKDISDFMYYPQSDNNPLARICKAGNEKDRLALYWLLDRLTERAAKLTAINLSSAVLKGRKGENPCAPVCIVAEGTTFYELKSLKSRVEFYLKDYLENKKQRFYEIVNIENATLIGAAIAGLTN